MKTIQALIPDTDFEFPYNNEQLVAYYPDADEVTYIDEVVDVSNEKLNQILSENYICSIDEISVLIKALSGLKHERFFELADFFLKKCSYISAFRFHDTDTIITIVERLMKLPSSAEMEDYLLDIMMEYEDEYPAVREKILEYF